MEEHRKNAKAPKPMQTVFAFHNAIGGESEGMDDVPRLLNLHDDPQLNHTVQVSVSPKADVGGGQARNSVKACSSLFSLHELSPSRIF